MKNKVCARANKLSGARSTAFVQSWKAEILRQRMQIDVVKFRFVKKDGEVREAVGTVHPLVIPALLNTTSRRKYNPEILTFYDVNKQAWRSCRVLNIL